MSLLCTQCMNRLHEVCIARERLESGGLIGLPQVTDRSLLRREIGAVLPGHVVFQVAPHPLDGVQLRTVRWSGYEAHVRRAAKPLGRVRPAVVEPQDVQAGGEGLGERVEEALKALGLEVRQLQEDPCPGRRGYRAIDIKAFEEVLP